MHDATSRPVNETIPLDMLHFFLYNTIQYNNNICRALFTKRPGPGALTETSDDMLCEIVQSLNGA